MRSHRTNPLFQEQTDPGSSIRPQQLKMENLLTDNIKNINMTIKEFAFWHDLDCQNLAKSIFTGEFTLRQKLAIREFLTFMNKSDK